MKTLNPEHIDVLLKFANASPFASLLGMKTIELGIDSCRMEMIVEEKHLNPYGGIHGGVYEPLIDSATYWAAYGQLDEADGLTTIDLKADLLGTVTKGTLIVTSKAVKVGRTVCLSEATITDQSGKLLCHGTSKLLVIKERQEQMKSQYEKYGITSIPPKFID